MQQQNKTWYVIATWSGKRREANSQYDKDQTYYLKYHIAQLSKIQHSIDRIIVMVPHNSGESFTFSRYLEEISGRGIEVIRRENVGLSYGSWLDAFIHYKESLEHPDWWIFMEDDYAPVINNFDKKMLDLFLEKKNCGFLCGLVWRNGYPLCAAISNGITRHEILERIQNQHSYMPSSSKGSYNDSDQVEFSQAFIKAGFNICDTRGCFCIAYNYTGKKMVIFHDKKLPLLMAPIQYHEIIESPELRKKYRNRIFKGKEGDD